MATTPTPPTEQTWLDRMAQDRQRTSYGLLAVGAILLIIPIWLGFKYRADLVYACVATFFVALVPLGAGLWNLMREPGETPEPDIARMLALVVGGLLGFGLVLVAGALAYHWWDHFSGGMKALQGKEGWRLWVDLILLLGGLALMFVSLQLGRTEERSNVTVRRLVYGYNAVLTGILLLAILAVVNVLAGVKLNTPFDWSTQSLYSLSPRSESILESLKEPLKIYMILPQDAEDTPRRMRALLANARAVNPKIEVESLSPDLDKKRVMDLAERYKFSDRAGVLVVAGVPPRENSQFITADSLYTGSGPAFMRQQREKRFFKGESELMQAITFLAEGKQKPIVYFTQGNDELDLNDASARELNVGAGELKRRLESDNFTVKGLRFTPLPGGKPPGPDVVVGTQVPEDASVVVVAGPRKALPKFALDALRNYLEPAGKSPKEKGRLLLLFDQALTPERDQLVKTGLEDLVATYNVQVGMDRVLRFEDMPELVIGYTNPAQDFRNRNPLGSAFFRKAFRFFQPRTIDVKTGGTPDSRYRAETLLFAADDAPIWVETDFRTPLQKLVDPERVSKKRSDKPLSIGLVVTEQEASADPHQPPNPGDETPRLVVVGSVTSASNLGVGNRAVFGPQYDLFQSMLAWLRARPTTPVGIEAKKQDVYELDTANVSFGKMFWLPSGLMFLGIVGTGIGVWVVRRR